MHQFRVDIYAIRSNIYKHRHASLTYLLGLLILSTKKKKHKNTRKEGPEGGNDYRNGAKLIQFFVQI